MTGPLWPLGFEVIGIVSRARMSAGQVSAIHAGGPSVNATDECQPLRPLE